MGEVKAIAAIVVTIALIVAIATGSVWWVNHKDWDAQRLRETNCITQGGAYIQTPALEGCFDVRPLAQ
jgi:hypothetical protein